MTLELSNNPTKISNNLDIQKTNKHFQNIYLIPAQNFQTNSSFF